METPNVPPLARNGILVDVDAVHVRTGRVEHGLEQEAFHDGPQTSSTGVLLYGRARHRAQSAFRHVESHVVDPELELVLLDQGILRLGHHLFVLFCKA